MADSPVPGARSAISELLWPFALLRIKALENAVAGHQSQLEELGPLRRDVLELHAAVSGLREARGQDTETALREAQSEQEERLSSEIASLADQMATLERCIEENDAKLNSVQTALLEGHVEAAVALDERLRAAKQPPPESSSLLCDVMQLEREVAAEPRWNCPRAVSGQGGREGSETAVQDLAKHVKALDSRVEECFRLLGEARRPGPPPTAGGAPNAGQKQPVPSGPRLMLAAREERNEAEFDDDVGEAERPVPRPCESRRACTSPVNRLTVPRQNAVH